MIKTRGKIQIIINNKIVEFHLVRKSFPIKLCGILGMTFLRENAATMTFSKEAITLKIQSANLVNTERIKLPARTRSLIALNVVNADLKEGYLEAINAGNGVFLGENLVKPKNGKIKIFAINSTLHDIELIIPPVKLQEFDMIPLAQRSLVCKSRLEKDKKLAVRFAKMVKLFDFSDLNDEERTIACFDHLQNFHTNFI